MEREIVNCLTEKGLKITAAESCTGGLFASKITAVPGSSSCFDGSFVTYSNEQKIRLLGVSPKTLEDFGAVSYQTALEMARGAKKSFEADIAVGITGIAGPGGGNDEKPVGTVYISVAFSGGEVAAKCLFSGNRDEVREQAVSFGQCLAKKILTEGKI